MNGADVECAVYPGVVQGVFSVVSQPECAHVGQRLGLGGTVEPQCSARGKRVRGLGVLKLDVVDIVSSLHSGSKLVLGIRQHPATHRRLSLNVGLIRSAFGTCRLY